MKVVKAKAHWMDKIRAKEKSDEQLIAEAEERAMLKAEKDADKQAKQDAKTLARKLIERKKKKAKSDKKRYAAKVERKEAELKFSDDMSQLRTNIDEWWTEFTTL